MNVFTHVIKFGKRIGYSNDSLKRKCEEHGEVHKQGQGVRRARGYGYATASPLFIYFALFFTLSFQRVVGVPYNNIFISSQSQND